MRIFLPLIAGMLIGAATLTFGQSDIGPMRETASPTPQNATEEIQMLTEKVQELEYMVEWQRNKINRLEQENWQLYKALRERQP